MVGSSPTRGSSFFLGKVTALGVLCCFALFVYLTLLASVFLPSHLSFKNMYILCLYILLKNLEIIIRLCCLVHVILSNVLHTHSVWQCTTMKSSLMNYSACVG